MERIFAFTDEYGAFGWDLDNLDVSTHFIITAIIVKESDLEVLRDGVEAVRKKHFQTGEMKSSKIGSNHARRKRVIADLQPLPFSIFTVVIYKNGLKNMPGLRYIQSFYKFTNNIVHKELRHAFQKLTITADEIGGNEFMKSFAKYVQDHQDVPTLLGEAEFTFENSKDDVILQVSDIISGTFACEIDLHKKTVDTPKYRHMLDRKIIRIKLYPKSYDSYTVENSALSEDYDQDIAELCFKQAVTFIEKYSDSEDMEIRAQIVILKYLLFRFMNNDLRKYIPTKELKQQLEYMEIGKVSTQTFRMRIIGKLRDQGVVIASSSKGYKIPSKQAELYDFINHGTSIIVPMLERLRKCRDLVKLSTANEVDLFDHTEYSSLKKYFDNL